MEMDQGRRTSQRAELLAAISGIRFMAEADGPYVPKKKKCKKQDLRKTEISWIIATDSEYVVKGMTEWLPAWQVSYFIAFPRWKLVY